MTTQTYLRQIEKIDNFIKNKQEYIEELKNSVFPKGIDYSKEKIVSTPQDRLSAEIARYLDEEKRVNEQISIWMSRKNKIIEQIEQLEIKHYNVLYYRYVKCMQWKEIIIKMKVSDTTAFEYHREALKEFENLFGRDHNFRS